MNLSPNFRKILRQAGNDYLPPGLCHDRNPSQVSQHPTETVQKGCSFYLTTTNIDKAVCSGASWPLVRSLSLSSNYQWISGIEMGREPRGFRSTTFSRNGKAVATTVQAIKCATSANRETGGIEQRYVRQSWHPPLVPCLVLGLTLVRLKAVGSNLLIILLQRRKVLTSFGELTLLHALANVPVHESAFAVHKVELVVKAGPGLSNGSRVGQHRDGTVHGGQSGIFRARSGNRNWLLVVDAELEASGAPLNHVERSLGLQSTNGSATVTRNDISSVQKSDGHVLAIARIAHHHLVVGLETYIDMFNMEVVRVGSA